MFWIAFIYNGLFFHAIPIQDIDVSVNNYFNNSGLSWMLPMISRSDERSDIS